MKELWNLCLRLSKHKRDLDIHKRVTFPLVTRIQEGPKAFSTPLYNRFHGFVYIVWWEQGIASG